MEIKRKTKRIYETLPSGMILPVDVVEYADIPRWPLRMLCDYCLQSSDRLWYLPHYGFSLLVMMDGRHVTLMEGAWASCVYCRAIRDSLELLYARVLTLAPDVRPDLLRELYPLVRDASYGEEGYWESGQEVLRTVRVSHDG